jgi:hypothetical protein
MKKKIVLFEQSEQQEHMWSSAKEILNKKIENRALFLSLASEGKDTKHDINDYLHCFRKDLDPDIIFLLNEIISRLQSLLFAEKRLADYPHARQILEQYKKNEVGSQEFILNTLENEIVYEDNITDLRSRVYIFETITQERLFHFIREKLVEILEEMDEDLFIKEQSVKINYRVKESLAPDINFAKLERNNRRKSEQQSILLRSLQMAKLKNFIEGDPKKLIFLLIHPS